MQVPQQRHPAAPLRASLRPQHVARCLGGSCLKLCSQGNFPNAAPEKPLQQREKCCFLVCSNVKYIKAYICFKVADVDLNHLLPHMDASTLRGERDYFLCIQILGKKIIEYSCTFSYTPHRCYRKC